MKARPIRTEELDLIRYLLEFSKDKEVREIPDLVIEMDDGGMGSLKFVANEAKYKDDLIEAKYIDADNMAVFISLNINDKNELFELDMWKADFSKLIKFPKPNEIIFE